MSFFVVVDLAAVKKRSQSLLEVMGKDAQVLLWRLFSIGILRWLDEFESFIQVRAQRKRTYQPVGNNTSSGVTFLLCAAPE